MSVRVLCLGNELLGDDAYGFVVAERLRQSLPRGVDIVSTSATGVDLMDHLEGISHLLVVDTVLTGKAEPGTIYAFREEDMKSVPGGSPHYIGLFEILALARKLRVAVPEEVVIVAVEAADCLTVGGTISAPVQAAIPVVTDLVREVVARFEQSGNVLPTAALDRAVGIVKNRHASHACLARRYPAHEVR